MMDDVDKKSCGYDLRQATVRKRKIASSRLRTIIDSQTSPIDVLPNQILVLNDDCLEQIWQYLSLEDILTVARIHVRFRTTARRRIVQDQWIAIDGEFTRKYSASDREVFYEACGPKTKEVTLHRLPEEEIVLALSHYGDLTYLTLSHIELRDSCPLNVLPSKLIYLKVVHCIIPDKFLQGWFRRLNSSLRVLYVADLRERGRNRLKASPFTALACLQNVLILMLLNMPHLQQILLKFIDQNRDNLTGLCFMGKGGTLKLKLWTSMAALTSIQSLHLGLVKADQAVLSHTIEEPTFPILSCLTISGTIFASLMNDINPQNALEDLCIFQYDFDAINWSHWDALQNLKKINIQQCSGSCPTILVLIQRLPLLEELIAVGFHLHLEMIEQLQEYLVSSGRILKLTSHYANIVVNTPNLVYTAAIHLAG